MEIKPIADRVVLVKEEEKEEKTMGGIILPNANKNASCMANVIAVGEGTSDVKMQVKVGDKVVYSKYSETEIELEGKKYIIVKHNDILAVIG